MMGQYVAWCVENVWKNYKSLVSVSSKFCFPNTHNKPTKIKYCFIMRCVKKTNSPLVMLNIILLLALLGIIPPVCCACFLAIS